MEAVRSCLQRGRCVLALASLAPWFRPLRGTLWDWASRDVGVGSWARSAASGCPSWPSPHGHSPS